MPPPRPGNAGRQPPTPWLSDDPNPPTLGKTGCHRLGQPAPAPKYKRESSVRPRPGTHKSCRASHSEAGGRRTQREQQQPGSDAGYGAGAVRSARSVGRFARGVRGAGAAPWGKKHGAKRRAFGLVPTGSNLVTETGQRGRLVAERARDCWFMSLAARRAGYLHSTCYLERPSVSATEQSSTRPPITEAMLPAWPAKVCAGANSR